MNYVLELLFCLITFYINFVVTIEPITMIGIGGAGLGLWNFNFLKDQTYCRFQECCNDRGIPGDVQGVQRKLREHLFGQHIVIKHLVPALKAHFTQNQSRKPLVISFHGTPGTGKNYVAELIATSLYAEGLNSKFVHKYTKADFPLATHANIYNAQISREVRDGINDCPRSMFIFDEVDKMPAGLFDSLASLVDYNGKTSQAIFLFLSNTAGVHISDRLGELMKEGIARQDTKLNHFEQILQLAAYNLEGGMKKTSLIEGHLIDHYLPFLPLEKNHVYKCIEAEFRRWNQNGNPTVIESIIQDVVTYDRNYGLFATAGCKNIEKKVAVQAKIRQEF